MITDLKCQSLQDNNLDGVCYLNYQSAIKKRTLCFNFLPAI